MRPRLSVVIPAYCEARNIAGTLENVTAALATLPIDPEILVVDDGSSDGTADVVRAWIRDHHDVPNIRLLVNERNMGFGRAYRRGVAEATGDFIVMVHGDNAWGAATLHDLFAQTGEADVVVGYTRAMWKSRTWTRTAISKTFTGLVNLITRRHIQYYNGLQIHRADVLKRMTVESSGHGFQAEVLAKALRETRTLTQVPMDLMEREHGRSKAFTLKNVLDVTRTILVLCRDGGPAR